jgi:hypothetical protein
MSEVHRQSRKTRFALAVAQGVSPQRWARKNKVSKSTVYRWAKEPKVRARIDSIRCRAIDRAVGRMAKHATWAVEGIVKLADNATSESVRLAALRTIYTQLTTTQPFGGLEDRIAKLEEQHHARPFSTS